MSTEPKKLLKPSPKIIDSHVHIWSSDLKKYPPAAGFTQKDYWFPKFTVDDLLKHCRPLGVTRFNLVQMTWYGLNHRYILDTIASSPKNFVGTGIVQAITDVAGPSPKRTMLALAKAGIVAFRIRGKSTRPLFKMGKQWMDHSGYNEMFRTGADHNLSLSFLMKPSDLPELNRMCTRFPDTPVILDHMGGIGFKGDVKNDQLSALCRMAQHPKVLVKIGAFWTQGSKNPPHLELLPAIKRIIDSFGPDRCMWESASGHFPLYPSEQRYKAGLKLIQDHADFLNPSDKEQLLFRTAQRLFFCDSLVTN